VVVSSQCNFFDYRLERGTFFFRVARISQSASSCQH
jgi:hypothetical protein